MIYKKLASVFLIAEALILIKSSNGFQDLTETQSNQFEDEVFKFFYLKTHGSITCTELEIGVIPSFSMLKLKCPSKMNPTNGDKLTYPSSEKERESTKICLEKSHQVYSGEQHLGLGKETTWLLFENNCVESSNYDLACIDNVHSIEHYDCKFNMSFQGGEKDSDCSKSWSCASGLCSGDSTYCKFIGCTQVSNCYCEARKECALTAIEKSTKEKNLVLDIVTLFAKFSQPKVDFCSKKRAYCAGTSIIVEGDIVNETLTFSSPFKFDMIRAMSSSVVYSLSREVALTTSTTVIGIGSGNEHCDFVVTCQATNPCYHIDCFLCLEKLMSPTCFSVFEGVIIGTLIGLLVTIFASISALLVFLMFIILLALLPIKWLLMLCSKASKPISNKTAIFKAKLDSTISKAWKTAKNKIQKKKTDVEDPILPTHTTIEPMSDEEYKKYSSKKAGDSTYLRVKNKDLRLLSGPKGIYHQDLGLEEVDLNGKEVSTEGESSKAYSKSGTFGGFRKHFPLNESEARMKSEEDNKKFLKIPADQTLEKRLGYHSMFGRGRPTSKSVTFKNCILVVSLSLFISCCGADFSNTMTIDQKECTEDTHGKITCISNFITELSLLPGGQISQLQVKTKGGKTLEILKVSAVSVDQDCSKKFLYYTYNPKAMVKTYWRCPTFCTGSTCSDMKSNDYKTEFGSFNDILGISKCFDGDSGWSHTCGSASSICVFTRSVLDNPSKVSFEVFSCPVWVASVHLSVCVQAVKKDDCKLIKIMPGEKIEVYGYTLILSSFSIPTLPILSSCFVKSSENGKIGVTSCSQMKTMQSGKMGEIQCQTESEAKSASKRCLFSPQSLTTERSGTGAEITSKNFNFVFDSENTLPLNMSGIVIREENGIVTSPITTISLIDLKISGINKTAITYSITDTLSALFIKMVGCYNCRQGSEITISCKSTKFQMIGILRCPSARNFVSLMCVPSSLEQSVRLSFNHANVDENCVLKWDSGEIKVNVHGSLSFVDDIGHLVNGTTILMNSTNEDDSTDKRNWNWLNPTSWLEVVKDYIGKRIKNWLIVLFIIVLILVLAYCVFLILTNIGSFYLMKKIM
jgi:hypothetical protein